MELNIAENRNHLNYSKWIYVKRILWTFGKFFFRNSPRIAFGYRNTILRLFGAKIGKTCPYLLLHRYLVPVESGNRRLECHWRRNPDL